MSSLDTGHVERCIFLEIPTELRINVYKLLVWKPIVFLASKNMHTAILRTNWKVYQEAQGILYSAIVFNQGEDIKCLRPEPDLLDPNGVTTLCSASFQFSAYFYFGSWQLDRTIRIRINKSFNINRKDRKPFKTFLASTSIFKDLAKVISNSTFVKVLNVDIGVEVEVVHHFDPGHEYTKVAQQKATDIFLDCGLLEPLRELTNVVKFNVSLLALKFADPEYQITARQNIMLQELEATIENNAKHLAVEGLKIRD
ncbi:uncharacterized protein LY89DRAFT_675730 [Mollisia scopiformis]|uniref:Uncharacterized protein n=1 Tax=Mollisia scopiformis TaxID=149040 RepID=A0A132BB03_MOLSC|nr:uncharacterized protein LY89DRAFT_675730 [Mollisia scopiformis]KUJ09558.1 hypothetical protein LY89DRAFT_675730 [Mollisia scopiformis]